MTDVLTLILGGGRGTRLYPLTRQRSKPAVPIAGKYRLVDVPISNCLHAGLHRIFVLTQFNSASLNRHIAQTYRMDHFSNGFVSIVGIRTNVRRGARITRSVLLGADFYAEGHLAGGDDIPLGIGRDVVLDRVIVDKNARIGDGARLVNERGVDHADGDGYCIRDGVIIVEKGALIPEGTVI